MTREEAIKILSNRDDFGIPKGYTSGYAEAIDIAIRSLEAWNNLAFEMETAMGYYDAFPDIWYGISESYDIIKKYLKEV